VFKARSTAGVDRCERITVPVYPDNDRPAAGIDADVADSWMTGGTVCILCQLRSLDFDQTVGQVVESETHGGYSNYYTKRNLPEPGVMMFVGLYHHP
jgi:hypothetical protein